MSDKNSVLSLDHFRAAASVLAQRLGLAKRAGMRFDGKRDYYDVFGYKTKLSYTDFLLKYERQDIASRIIDAPPSATWSNPPIFTDSKIQEAWNLLNKRYNLWSILERADRLSRMGEFSLIIIGATGSPTTELTASSKLLYLKPVGMNYVTNITLEDNPTSARFGKPKMYTIKTSVPRTVSMDSEGGIGGVLNSVESTSYEIHHSRVIHIVEHTLDDSLFGIPILARVFNLLDDLLKVAGGTSETYWITANRGLQVDIDKEMDLQPDDAKALSDEIEEYIHGLRRFIRTRGVKMNDLGSDTPAPSQVFEMLIALISGTTGIPRRILIGSEAGQLASEQDRANWAERVTERRELFAEPVILRPVCAALQLMKLLPGSLETLDVEWPSAFIMSPLEASMVMAQTARAIGNISRQTGNKNPMQLTSRAEGRALLGLKGDLPAAEIVKQPVEAPRGNNLPAATPEDGEGNENPVE